MSAYGRTNTGDQQSCGEGVHKCDGDVGNVVIVTSGR